MDPLAGKPTKVFQGVLADLNIRHQAESSPNSRYNREVFINEKKTILVCHALSSKIDDCLFEFAKVLAAIALPIVHLIILLFIQGRAGGLASSSSPPPDKPVEDY